MRTFKGFRKSIQNTANKEIESFYTCRNNLKARVFLRLLTPGGDVFEIEMSDEEARELAAALTRWPKKGKGEPFTYNPEREAPPC